MHGRKHGFDALEGRKPFESRSCLSQTDHGAYSTMEATPNE